MSRRVGPYDNAIKTRRDPSNRWRRASAALAKAQGRIADERRDELHKFTTSLAREFGTVVMEDLHAPGRSRNIGSPGTSRTLRLGRRQLEYKTVWSGGRTVVVDRWFHPE